MKKGLRKGPFSFHGEVPFGEIRKRPGCADLRAERFALTEVAGHGPFGNGMKHWSAVRTGIETGLAADAPFFIRYHCARFGIAFSGTGRTNSDAGWFFTMLADDGDKDRDLFPFLHLYPREGRTAGPLMGEAADHFTGLTPCAAFGDNGNRIHLEDLPKRF